MSDGPQDSVADPIAETIVRMAEARGAGKTLCPSEVARALGGEDWRRRMKDVRRAAVTLALAGRIAIYRKGKKVDPLSFKGVIRLGLP